MEEESSVYAKIAVQRPAAKNSVSFFLTCVAAL